MYRHAVWSANQLIYPKSLLALCSPLGVYVAFLCLCSPEAVTLCGLTKLWRRSFSNKDFFHPHPLTLHALTSSVKLLFPDDYFCLIGCKLLIFLLKQKRSAELGIFLDAQNSFILSLFLPSVWYAGQQVTLWQSIKLLLVLISHSLQKVRIIQWLCLRCNNFCSWNLI